MNNKYLFQDLVQSVLDAHDLDKKEAESFVRTFFAVIENAIFEGDFVKINDLGKFNLQKVEARKSVNVNTGEAFEIMAHYKLSFVPGNSLKEEVNKPYAHLEPIELDAVEQDAVQHQTLEETSNPNIYITKEDITMKKKEEAVFVVSDKPAANDKKTPPAPQKSKKGKLLAWITFVIIMCALIIFALVKTVFSDSKDEPRTEEVVTTVEPSSPVVKKVSPPAPKVVDPASWEILKVVRLEPGKRLTLLSLQYYGNKVFWVYIYEANKDHIKNPNKILAGTKIRIPKPDPAVINAKDSESLRIAKEKETKYRAQFSK